MTANTMQAIARQTQHKNYVTPIVIDERQLGWNKYAAKMSIESCRTDAQRRGWLAANRAEAYAQVMVTA